MVGVVLFETLDSIPATLPTTVPIFVEAKIGILEAMDGSPPGIVLLAAIVTLAIRAELVYGSGGVSQLLPLGRHRKSFTSFINLKVTSLK